MIERDTLVEAVAASLGVVLFGVLAVYVGSEYGITDGGNVVAVTTDGSTALIGAVAAFLLYMTLVGYWLSTRD